MLDHVRVVLTLLHHYLHATLLLLHYWNSVGTFHVTSTRCGEPCRDPHSTVSWRQLSMSWGVVGSCGWHEIYIGFSISIDFKTKFHRVEPPLYSHMGLASDKTILFRKIKLLWLNFSWFSPCLSYPVNHSMPLLTVVQFVSLFPSFSNFFFYLCSFSLLDCFPYGAHGYIAYSFPVEVAF